MKCTWSKIICANLKWNQTKTKSVSTKMDRRDVLVAMAVYGMNIKANTTVYWAFWQHLYGNIRLPYTLTEFVYGIEKFVCTVFAKSHES